MRKYLAESIGTFALVLCGTGAIVIDQQTNGGVSHVGVAITFGFIVMAMIYALGDISGAHLNSAGAALSIFAWKYLTSNKKSLCENCFVQ
jgi:aquaporin NIP